MTRRTEISLLGGVMVMAAGVFAAGIGWGLPSKNVDRFLFGDRPAWTGEQVATLAPAGRDDAGRAADVSAKPIDRGAGPLVVNGNDEDRARIVRRYRLMSHQPDEFTTFAALARMKPGRGDLDPRMYKYGGLWVYPVGALLKIASALKLIDLRADMTWYLDHPEAFGRFYVVARLYSALWGLVGVWAAYALVRRISGNPCAGIVGAACFALMPMVVNAAHEAKPHLAGAVLMLLAVLAAARFVEKGRGRIFAALLCGAAVAMVPSALPVLLVIPGMFLMRRPGRSLRGVARGTLTALGVAGVVFVASNPFVLMNLVRNREVLRSNVGNSAAFYSPGLTGNTLANAALLVGLGMSFLLAVAGIAGAIALGVRAWTMRRAESNPEQRRRDAGLLLALPTLTVGAAFVLLAGGQPADYARFALPFDLFLLVEAIVAIATFVPPGWTRCSAYTLLIASTAWMGQFYLRGFVRDASPNTTRTWAAAEIHRHLTRGDAALVTPIEPAPWSMPPVDLFRWRIVLDRNRTSGTSNVAVRPVDIPSGGGALKFLNSTPISWASRRFEIVPPGAGEFRENAGPSR